MGSRRCMVISVTVGVFLTVLIILPCIDFFRYVRECGSGYFYRRSRAFLYDAKIDGGMSV